MNEADKFLRGFVRTDGGCWEWQRTVAMIKHRISWRNETEEYAGT